ncbi:hypothetical protein [Allorhodopirellula heiligendammensis]|uniref:Uncharacterized protein n=1 Tax=Allorhodopirellula heiligendammensis TaxID=2714739 RepID=A0A5C6C557_9BACT|nr:hypothetical protein [Allorhodopirellula heiligendammensis]TWU19232.1 hypothetical protein Poly21_14030 [Allorhodopirellula heiligendammensis]
MAKPAKLKPDSQSIAVIRSYHPIRIERELLDQVFDLAERGCSAGNSGVARLRLDADTIDDQRTEPSKQHDFGAQSVPQQRDQLEAVA